MLFNVCSISIFKCSLKHSYNLLLTNTLNKVLPKFISLSCITRTFWDLEVIFFLEVTDYFFTARYRYLMVFSNFHWGFLSMGSNFLFHLCFNFYSFINIPFNILFASRLLSWKQFGKFFIFCFFLGLQFTRGAQFWQIDHVNGLRTVTYVVMVLYIYAIFNQRNSKYFNVLIKSFL